MNDTITAIKGIKVGHATNPVARTGCTVILCESGAVAGVDVRGSAPGTRETDAIRPGGLVQRAHTVLLTGGSAFGLDAAGGVMQYLEERGIGFPAGSVRVPIVPAAVIFDLGVGDAKVRPDQEMGYRACVNATNQPVKMGQIGAGAGATVGKAPGCIPSNGGVGSACRTLKSGLSVGAIVVVNALGNVVHPTTGEIVAGARHKKTGEFVDIVARLSDATLPFHDPLPSPTSPPSPPLEGRGEATPFPPGKGAGGLGGVGGEVRNEGGTFGTNTTIGVVATNAELSPTAVTKVAQMAHDGLARAVRPAHTMFDGDTIFALSLGTETASSPDAIGSAEVNTIGIVAAEVMAEAILRAVTCRET